MDPDDEKVEYWRMVSLEAETISKKTRAGDFWGRDGALKLERTRLGRERSTWTLSAASSTYYAAGGNAAARAKKNPLWLLPAIWCLIRARKFSNRMKNEAGGLEKLTPAELDVRASICGKCSFWPGSKKERKDCLETALAHPECTAETSALCLIQLTEMKKKPDPLRDYNLALALLEQLSPMTVCRILRSKARCISKVNGSAVWRKAILTEALEIAQANNLGDQVSKIKTEMATR